jgi:hypothetical protein
MPRITVGDVITPKFQVEVEAHKWNQVEAEIAERVKKGEKNFTILPEYKERNNPNSIKHIFEVIDGVAYAVDTTANSFAKDFKESKGTAIEKKGSVRMGA